jgi:hypothetical protein
MYNREKQKLDFIDLTAKMDLKLLVHCQAMLADHINNVVQYMLLQHNRNVKNNGDNTLHKKEQPLPTTRL